jgi:hypothetical protein
MRNYQEIECPICTDNDSDTLPVYRATVTLGRYDPNPWECESGEVVKVWWPTTHYGIAGEIANDTCEHFALYNAGDSTVVDAFDEKFLSAAEYEASLNDRDSYDEDHGRDW